jgi:hypothetical protein
MFESVAFGAGQNSDMGSLQFSELSAARVEKVFCRFLMDMLEIQKKEPY